MQFFNELKTALFLDRNMGDLLIKQHQSGSHGNIFYVNTPLSETADSVNLVSKQPAISLINEHPKYYPSMIHEFKHLLEK